MRAVSVLTVSLSERKPGWDGSASEGDEEAISTARKMLIAGAVHAEIELCQAEGRKRHDLCW
jgi:hypothetical protein